MADFEQMVLELAQKCHDKPPEFVRILEDELKQTNMKDDKKGELFMEAGIILYNHFDFEMALLNWDKSLDYYKKNNNKNLN